MKIETVSIKRLRSIEDCEVLNCGDFNVFIGKNNSGKSNLLSAIDTFFSCISSGNIVTNRPAMGEIDFYGRKTQVPIDITLTFSLSSDEFNAIVQDIVAEAPHRKNVIGNTNPYLFHLSIIVSIINVNSSGNYFSFVSKIALKSPQSLSQQNEISILNMSIEAAAELHDKLNRFNQESQDMKFLERLQRRAEDSSRNLSEERVSPSSILRRTMATAGTVPTIELRRELDYIASKSSTIEEFSIRVHDLLLKEQNEPKTEKIQLNSLNNRISTFSGDESSLPNYVVSLLKRVSDIKVLYLKERRKEIGKEEAERILSLKVERGGDETLRNIQSIVSSLLGVKINAFRSRGAISAELDIDEFLVEVNGSGIREALRLVLDVLFIQPNILLVEEPEIHLHPALETSMMQYLKQISSNIQIFITTHSTNFLDTTEMKNVYLVSKPSATHVQHVNFGEAESLIPKELGIRLSSLFMFDRLVFVEGSSDENIFRAWATTLGLNFSQANVGFIPMQGARNFIYFAREATLSFLKKRQVRMWFVIDRDERDEAESDRLKKALEGNAVFKVLKKREIENYLISPRPIIEFLKEKSSADLVLTEDIVSRIIDECAEQLKQFTINKRLAKVLCKPIYPSMDWDNGELKENSGTEKIIAANQSIADKLVDANKRAEKVYGQQSEYVNKAWQSEKLSLVPGDELLDAVFRKYNVRFKKDLDGFRLASFMTETEIDREIQVIIREICG